MMEEIGLELVFPDLRKNLWKTLCFNWLWEDEENHAEDADGLTLGCSGLGQPALPWVTAQASRGRICSGSLEKRTREGGREGNETEGVTCYVGGSGQPRGLGVASASSGKRLTYWEETTLKHILIFLRRFGHPIDDPVRLCVTLDPG
jgi:hypothetical protein